MTFQTLSCLRPVAACFAVVLAATLVAPAGAQVPFLVADIDITGEPYVPECPPGPCPPYVGSLYGGLPEQLTPWSDLLAFVANDRVHGFEPWISDGTPAGTRLLADLVPGEDGSDVRILGAVGGDLLFWSASMDPGPCGLWLADRETLTVAPVDLDPEHPLASEQPGSCDVQVIDSGVVFEGFLFFEVSFPPPGAEHVVARSDGTAEGTEIVLQISGPQEPSYSALPRLAVLGSSLYIGARSGLYQLADPEGDAHRLGQVGQPVDGPPLPDLACVGELEAFDEPGFVRDLFFVSGCEERRLYDLFTYPTGGSIPALLHRFERQPSGLFPEPAQLTVTGETLFFALYLFDDQDGAEIWSSGGPDGLGPVATGFRRNGFAFPGLVPVGDRVLFGATPQHMSSRFLYAVAPDGDLDRLVDGPAHLSAVGSLGSRAFLSLRAGDRGAEPWLTDGTPEGTALLADLEPGELGSAPREPTRVGDLLFFSARTDDLGRELWALRLSELAPPSPPPPFDEWIEPPAFADFRFQVRITPDPGEIMIRGLEVPGCQDDTVCVSGAVAGRPEVYLRVLGPRPNGFLWPTVVRFTPSRVEVWIEQESTGEVNYYDLPAVGPGEPTLAGRQDRTGFSP